MARPGPARRMPACAAMAAIAVLTVPAAAEASYAQRNLSQGSHGRDVKLLQKYLTRARFRTSVDGRYGAATVSAVRRFEGAANRRFDGRASPADQRVVQSAARAGGLDGVATGGVKYEQTAAP